MRSGIHPAHVPGRLTQGLTVDCDGRNARRFTRRTRRNQVSPVTAILGQKRRTVQGIVADGGYCPKVLWPFRAALWPVRANISAGMAQQRRRRYRRVRG